MLFAVMILSLLNTGAFTPLIVKRVGIQHHRSDYIIHYDIHGSGNYTHNLQSFAVPCVKC